MAIRPPVKLRCRVFKQLRMAQGDTNSAKREAQEAYDKALMLRNMTQGSSDMFSDLLRRMENFQNQRGARPAEIRAVRRFFILSYESFLFESFLNHFFTNIFTQRTMHKENRSAIIIIVYCQ